MKKFFTLPALVALAVIVVNGLPKAVAGDEGWTTDYKKAVEQAKAEKKLVLLDFTGSDWCGWCKKLDREVFSQAKFKEYAAKNLILVTVDFPQAKEQTVAVKKQNQALQDQFKVDGYPTIIMLNGDGKKVGELGYMEGGAEAFVAALEKVPRN